MLASATAGREKNTADKTVYPGGVDFLFSRDPVRLITLRLQRKPAATGEIRLSGLLYHGYIADCGGAGGLGYGRDPRLANTLKLIKDKQTIRDAG